MQVSFETRFILKSLRRVSHKETLIVRGGYYKFGGTVSVVALVCGNASAVLTTLRIKPFAAAMRLGTRIAWVKLNSKSVTNQTRTSERAIFPSPPLELLSPIETTLFGDSFR